MNFRSFPIDRQLDLMGCVLHDVKEKRGKKLKFFIADPAKGHISYEREQLRKGGLEKIKMKLRAFY